MKAADLNEVKVMMGVLRFIEESDISRLAPLLELIPRGWVREGNMISLGKFRIDISREGMIHIILIDIDAPRNHSWRLRIISHGEMVSTLKLREIEN